MHKANYAALALVLAGATLTGAAAHAQGKLSAAPPPTYDNKYEIYGGINFMNFQAGQDLPTRMNLGGIETEGTYWLTRRVGLAAEFRGEAGTTPVSPTAFAINSTDRPLVVLYSGLFGAQYRGPKNRRFAVDYHGYGGIAHGDFTESGLSPTTGPYATGLYTNRNAPLFALGGSLDINRSKNLALRLSPDLILEHFGTETREFFAISAGVVYRIGTK